MSPSMTSERKLTALAVPGEWCNVDCLFVIGTTAPSGPGLPHSRGF
jgi:hypothetical protein